MKELYLHSRLTWRDGFLLCRAAAYLVVFAAVLRLAGLRTCLRLSGSAGDSSRGLRECDPGFPDRAGLALDRARKLLGVGSCLSRSLALRRVLASAGIAAAVRIGTRRDGGNLAAHAWVELAGRPLGTDAGVPGYRSFPARL